MVVNFSHWVMICKWLITPAFVILNFSSSIPASFIFESIAWFKIYYKLSSCYHNQFGHVAWHQRGPQNSPWSSCLNDEKSTILCKILCAILNDNMCLMSVNKQTCDKSNPSFISFACLLKNKDVKNGYNMGLYFLAVWTVKFTWLQG